MVTSELQKNFNFWLESIFEDNQVPLEIRIIIIYIVYNDKQIYLSLGGCENAPDINNLQYNPLEAQFFYDKNLTTELYINHINNEIKSLILESTENKIVKKNLKSKKVYSYLNGKYTLLIKG